MQNNFLKKSSPKKRRLSGYEWE